MWSAVVQAQRVRLRVRETYSSGLLRCGDGDALWARDSERLRENGRMGGEGGVAKRRNCSGVKLNLEEDAEAIQSASQELVNLPRAPQVFDCTLR